MRYFISSLMTFVIFSACGTTPPKADEQPTDYEKQILAWHQSRNDRLNQVDGWLTLAGLFWLEEGENRFGSRENNQVVFPGPDVPAYMGSFFRNGDSVSVKVADGIVITLLGAPVNERGLKKDSSGEPDVLTWKNLSWYIIQRGERIGVRLKDAKNPNYVNFKPTELYPIDSTWRVPASLEEFDTTTYIDISNVLGDTSPSRTPGLLHFEINGSPYTLNPLADPGDDSYFIIFGDKTNGLSTYGAGRFLVVPAVDESGHTMIDFNKAYNMPCVFSPYATCPLPPPQNMLPIAITAGELDYHIAGGH